MAKLLDRPQPLALASGVDAPPEDVPMTVLEHLGELRSRLIKMLLGILPGMWLAWEYKEYLLDFLLEPLTQAWKKLGLGEPTIHFSNPVDLFVAYMKIAAVCGFLASSPWVFYQLWAFIAPGLYKRERFLAIPFVLASTICFAGGAFFGYSVVFPLGFETLLGMSGMLPSASIRVQPTIMIAEYMGFATRMLLAFGTVFEVPVVVTFLSLVGFVNWKQLLKFGRWWVVIAAVIAAVLTPPDVGSQLLMLVPLVVLYFMSVGLAYLFGPKVPPVDKPKVKPAPREQPWAGVAPAFVASLRLLRRRPVVLPAFGAAIVLSLLSVFCAIGLATTPWFLCELFAMQLALSTGKPVVHRASWFAAGAILLGAVLLVTGVVALTLVGAGAELPPEATPVSGMTALLRSGGFYAASSGTLALLFLVPVLYAPLVLLERGLTLPEALLESVRIVVRHGLWTSLCLSLAAHLVQLAPLIAAGAWAAYGARSVVVALLMATPLLAFSVPLGQGMIIWSYVVAGAEPTDLPASGAAPSERTRLALRRIARWTTIWSVAVVLPIIALLLLGMSLGRPSRLPGGAAPNGELVCELAPIRGGVRRAALDNTALELSASPEWVRVEAADGGGTGRLELREPAPISGVRVVRVRDAFAVEVRQGEIHSLTWIDRAGVRLDDDLRARLTDRVPARGVAFVVLLPFLATLGTVPVLRRLGRVQHAFRKFGDRRPSDEVLDLALRRSVRRTQAYVALLLPLDLFALGLAARSLGLC